MPPCVPVLRLLPLSLTWWGHSVKKFCSPRSLHALHSSEARHKKCNYFNPRILRSSVTKQHTSARDCSATSLECHAASPESTSEDFGPMERPRQPKASVRAVRPRLASQPTAHCHCCPPSRPPPLEIVCASKNVTTKLQGLRSAWAPAMEVSTSASSVACRWDGLALYDDNSREPRTRNTDPGITIERGNFFTTVFDELRRSWSSWWW